MIQIEKKDNYVILTNSFDDFEITKTQFSSEIDSFKDFNIIIDLRIHKNLSTKDVESFLPLSKKHKKSKKSFVLVTSELDFNSISDKLAVVRSMQEAFDIIEMEEIERDLGF